MKVNTQGKFDQRKRADCRAVDSIFTLLVLFCTSCAPTLIGNGSDQNQGLSPVTGVTNTTGGTGAIHSIDAPTISSVSPSTGTYGGGVPVTITGTGFLSGATVTIGGSTCTDPVITGTTQIVCTAPAGTPGTADVVVTNTAGPEPHGTVTDSAAYTYEMISLRAVGRNAEPKK